MSRSERQLKIIELVKKYEINTQDDLVKRLVATGFEVTQATVSRDIKELSLIKTMTDGERYKYTYVKTDRDTNLLFKLFKETIVSVNSAENIIVIKCIAAGASAIAAMIDKMEINGIVGTLAGDDTVLVIVTSVSAVKGVLEKLKQLTD
jgi:transcriptional regulator of arginine metabolism